jgi:hypothetical protein
VISANDIERLSNSAAFTPSRKYPQLADEHVPFDQLTAKTSYEARAIGALENDRDVGILGPRGGGKSSLIAYVSGQLGDEYLVLRVPVTGADDPTKTANVTAVALNAALRTIDLDRRERGVLEQARADQATRERTSGAGGGSIGGGPLPFELHRELRTLSEQLANNQLADERLAGLDRLISILHNRDLRPVFVLEDTEAAIGGSDHPELTAGFLNGPVRAFTQELQAPCIIAVQDAFKSSPEYRELVATVQDVTLPILTEASLATIIEHRLRREAIDAAATELVSTRAFSMLIGFYGESENSLRFTLSALQTAVGHAAEMVAERVEEGHMRAAVNEWKQQVAG